MSHTKQWRIIGVFLIIFSFFCFWGTYKEATATKEGQKITVTVTKKYIGGGLRSNTHDVDFTYNSKNYSKQISKDEYESISVGDTIQLVYSDEYDVFVNRSGSPMNKLYIDSFFLLAGLLLVIFAKRLDPAK